MQDFYMLIIYPVTFLDLLVLIVCVCVIFRSFYTEDYIIWEQRSFHFFLSDSDASIGIPPNSSSTPTCFSSGTTMLHLPLLVLKLCSISFFFSHFLVLSLGSFYYSILKFMKHSSVFSILLLSSSLFILVITLTNC